MRAILSPPQGTRLEGSPMTLLEVTQYGASRDQKAALIDAYWRLSAAVADYYLGVREAGDLSKLKSQTSGYSTVLSEAERDLATRVGTSLLAAEAAQLRLAGMLGTGVRPLPSDAPFCERYATRFEDIFGGSGPSEARLLNELLPQRLAELRQAAESVTRSTALVDQVASQRSGSADSDRMVHALQLLALNRRAFVQIARNYNEQINRYSQIASPGNVETGRLVAMLIRLEDGNRLAAGDPNGAQFRSPSQSTFGGRPSGASGSGESAYGGGLR
ncbi:hypothetical protein [Pseudobythopirellula maris]|nr:hypothetical protein [Pseudobythopirellula maris]